MIYCWARELTLLFSPPSPDCCILKAIWVGKWLTRQLRRLCSLLDHQLALHSTRGRGSLDPGGEICVCVCVCLRGGPQLKEHHGGSHHKKTDHFIWEFEGTGRDSTFWLTKTMPREKRLPKITAEETWCLFFFFLCNRRRKGVFWLLRVENNRQRLF